MLNGTFTLEWFRSIKKKREKLKTYTFMHLWEKLYYFVTGGDRRLTLDPKKVIKMIQVGQSHHHYEGFARRIH